MNALVIAWYLVLSTGNGGITTVPAPYTNQGECLEAAKQIRIDRKNEVGPYVYGNCVPVKVQKG